MPRAITATSPSKAPPVRSTSASEAVARAPIRASARSAKAGPRGRGVGRSAEELDPDPEGDLGVQPPGLIHRRLEREGGLETVGDLGLGVHSVEEPGIEEGVEGRRPPRQGAREARRERHDPHHQVQQLGLGQQKGLQLHARSDAGKEIPEPVKGHVRRAGGGDRVQQPGRQAGEQLAPALGAGRADAAMVPTTDGARDPRRVGEPHPRQGRQRLRIVFHAREDQAAVDRGQRLFAGEQFTVDRVHRAKRSPHGRVERPEPLVTRQGGDRLPGLVVLGEAVGLLVADHLGPMFERAELSIGVSEDVGVLRLDVAEVREGAEGLQSAARPQRRLAPAQDELLGLDEEFDLADPAAPKLEIGARRGQPIVHLVGVDLPLDRMDVGDSGKVQIAPPDEGLEVGEESLSQRFVAADGAGLDEGRPFPILPHRLVVDVGRREGDRRRRGRRVRAKAQVDPEDIALDGPPLEDLRHAVGEAAGERLGLDACAQS